MADYEILWEDGPVFRQAEHFRLGTDSVLLADFASPAGTKKGIDLGCASGILMLLLLSKNDRLSMTGVEIVEAAVAAAQENMDKNGFASKTELVCGDIREYKKLFRAGSFDFVISNPPYFPDGSGEPAKGSERAAARGEMNCTLSDVCSAASWLLHTGGTFYCVGRPERLAEIIRHMCDNGIEPKRLRFVTNKAASAPSLFLIEGKRGGRPGLRAEPALVIHNDDGSETAEVLTIYHRNK